MEQPKQTGGRDVTRTRSIKVTVSLKPELKDRLQGQADLLGVPLTSYMVMSLANSAIGFERMADATNAAAAAAVSTLADRGEHDPT